MDARQGRADIDTMKAERMFYLGLLASVHLEAGDLVESVQTLELVLELDPNDIGTSNDLGYSLADAGQQLDRAETLARYAVANEPRNSAFLDSLGWVLYKKGDVAGAKHWLTLARFAGAKMTQQSRFAGAGEDPVVCDHLGDACWRLGDKAEAQKWWQQSVEFAGESLDTAGPSRTYERTLQSVRAKLAAAASGGEPAVAELGENVEE
jgi:Tfp pilus assembly protein PilF